MSVIEEIAAERRRQIDVEGWTPEHDDTHVNGEMADAAACYAHDAGRSGGEHRPMSFWPWSREWWKPSKDRRRDLIKAGALIVAEIERLDRTTPPVAGSGAEG